MTGIDFDIRKVWRALGFAAVVLLTGSQAWAAGYYNIGAFVKPTPLNGFQLVQAQNGTGISSTSASVPALGAEYPGDTIIVGVYWSDVTSTISSVTDSMGNTYTAAGSILRTAGGGVSLAVYYAKNILTHPGVNTVKATFSTSVTTSYIELVEYSGLSTTSPLDQTASGTATTGTAVSAGPVTTTSANELILGFAYTGSTNILPGTGFQNLPSAGAQLAWEQRTVSSTGSYSATATLPTSGGWGMIMATFKMSLAASPIQLIQAYTNESGTSASTIAYTYPGAQLLGDLNVVVAAWSDSTHTVSSVTDTAGNTYTQAGSTNAAYSMSESIYYAKNIVASSGNSNTVTVTYSGSVPSPTIRLVEYSGLSKTAPLDATGSYSGSTGKATGSITTTATSEVVVSAVRSSSTSSCGVSGTWLILDTTNCSYLMQFTPLGVGTFTSAQGLIASPDWLMQLASFKP